MEKIRSRGAFVIPVVEFMPATDGCSLYHLNSLTYSTIHSTSSRLCAHPLGEWFKRRGSDHPPHINLSSGEENGQNVHPVELEPVSSEGGIQEDETLSLLSEISNPRVFSSEGFEGTVSDQEKYSPEVRSVPEMEMQRSEGDKIVCRCGKLFGREGDLKRHLKFAQPHCQSKGFPCICNKAFSRKDALNVNSLQTFVTI